MDPDNQFQMLGCVVNHGRRLELMMQWPEAEDPNDHGQLGQNGQGYQIPAVHFDDPFVLAFIEAGPFGFANF